MQFSWLQAENLRFLLLYVRVQDKMKYVCFQDKTKTFKKWSKMSSVDYGNDKKR